MGVPRRTPKNVDLIEDFARNPNFTVPPEGVKAESEPMPGGMSSRVGSGLVFVECLGEFASFCLLGLMLGLLGPS